MVEVHMAVLLENGCGMVLSVTWRSQFVKHIDRVLLAGTEDKDMPDYLTHVNYRTGQGGYASP